MLIREIGSNSLVVNYFEKVQEENSADDSTLIESHQVFTEFNQMQDLNFDKYFFCQLHSIVGGSLSVFETLIDACPNDSYFVKANKAFAYLNALRERTDLRSLTLPNRGDVYTNFITLYKEGYQEGRVRLV